MRALATLVCLLPAASVAQPAQSTQRVGYQGRLLRPDGAPETGPKQFRFAIFDAAEGGAVKWSEEQTLALSDGYYSAMLGAEIPLAATVFGGGDRWLEISVGGTALTPRQPIGSVPYAQMCTRLFGGDVDASSIGVNGTTVIDSNGSLAVGSSLFQADQGGSIELGASGGKPNPGADARPYIDFHYGNGAAQDYNVRIVNEADGQLAFQAKKLNLPGEVNAPCLARALRYEMACLALAGSKYTVVAAVSLNTSAYVGSGNQVCANYVGNNSIGSWTCIGVPYVYGYDSAPGGDVRPTWSDCQTVHGPKATGGNGYGWFDRTNCTGVMMACCVK